MDDASAGGLVSMDSGDADVDRDFAREEEVTEYVAPVARYSEEFAAMQLELERAAARAKTTVTQIVEQLHASAPPEAEWIEYFTEGGRPYYYNEASGESRWQCPVPEQMGLELDLATQLGGGGGDLVDLEALAAGVEGSLRRGRDDDDESEMDDDEGSQASFARRAATARSVGSVGSYGSGVPLTPSVLAKRDELASHDNETRQAREQILLDEEQEQALARGEASEARIALTARNFWTSVRDAAIEVRIGNWILERREMHEREMREMHRNMKADYRFNKTERKDETFATMLALAAEEDATVDDELALADDGTVDEEAEREKRLQRIQEDMARKMEEKARAESREGLQALAKRDLDMNFDGDADELARVKLAETLQNVAKPSDSGMPLREIVLVQCNVGDDEVSLIADALTLGAVTRLELGGNRVTSEGAEYIATKAGRLCSLRELHLNGNDIGDWGIEALCKGFWGWKPRQERDRLERKKHAKAEVLARKRGTHARDGVGDKQKNAKKKKETHPAEAFYRLDFVSRLAVFDVVANPVSSLGAVAVAESLVLATCKLKVLRLGGVPQVKAAFKPGARPRANRPGNVGAELRNSLARSRRS